MILPDGRVKCNICGWEVPATELWNYVERGIEQACPLCYLDPHDPTFHHIPNDGRTIWKCDRCGYEKIASCLWQEPRCEKCGYEGSFTFLDLPVQMGLFQ